MKIIDTTTFYEENMMMDIRFNILDKFVDHFVVCEALFTHSGKKKKINFNINDYPKFKDRIKHIIIEDEPAEIVKEIKNKKDFNIRLNSIKRIAAQRDYIKNALSTFSKEDYVIYSDNDEIPNLENFNFNENKNKIILFKQIMYYYKFNLKNNGVDWFGSKACKIKNLKSIDWLRNIKPKKYSFFRMDTFFSKLKYIDINIHEKGGWHFTDMIEKKVIKYNHFAKKNSKDRFTERKLEVVDVVNLPKFIQSNRKKFHQWFV